MVAPHKDHSTQEECQLKIEFSGLTIGHNVIFGMDYEPGLGLGSVKGISSDELTGETFVTPFNRVLFKLNTAASYGWGFNSTVTVVAKQSVQMCDETLDLTKKEIREEMIIKSKYYPETLSGYLHCFYHVKSLRNTIIQYKVLDYSLDTNGLKAPVNRLILSEEVVHTDVMVEEIADPIMNKTYLLYPDEKVTVTLPLSGLGRQTSSSSTYTKAKLRYKAVARAVPYWEGRQCGRDVVLNCEESDTFETPVTGNNGSQLCIYHFQLVGNNCSLHLDMEQININSPYSKLDIYKGHINHTRSYEFPYMVRHTNFVHWYYHGAKSENTTTFLFDEPAGYVVTRVADGTNHIQARFTVSTKTLEQSRNFVMKQPI